MHQQFSCPILIVDRSCVVHVEGALSLSLPVLVPVRSVPRISVLSRLRGTRRYNGGGDGGDG